MKNKEPTKLIERNKDTGIDLEVKVNKKTGKIIMKAIQLFLTIQLYTSY